MKNTLNKACISFYFKKVKLHHQFIKMQIKRI
nr:MAG TPA: hypothetical protein [Caudoviricetes sp.]